MKQAISMKSIAARIELHRADRLSSLFTRRLLLVVSRMVPPLPLPTHADLLLPLELLACLLVGHRRLPAFALAMLGAGCSGSGGGSPSGFGGSWSPPALLGTSGAVVPPSAGVDDAGHAIVVGGSRADVYANGNWSRETLPGAASRLIVQGSRGLVLSRATATDFLHGRVFESGILASDEIVATTTGNIPAFVPLVQEDGLAAVYAEDADGVRISVRAWLPGTGWQMPLSLPVSGSPTSRGLFATGLANGNLVVWQEFDTIVASGYALLAAALVDSVWTVPVQLAGTELHALATLSDGRALLIASEDFDAAHAFIFDPSSGWTEPAILDLSVFDLSIEVDGAGGAIVASGEAATRDFARFDGSDWHDVAEIDPDIAVSPVSIELRAVGDGFAFELCGGDVFEDFLGHVCVFSYSDGDFREFETIEPTAFEFGASGVDAAALNESGAGIVTWTQSENGTDMIWVSLRE